MRVCRRCFGLYGPDQMVCPKDATPTESHIDILIGQQLGAYVVRSLVGEGGMGVVYAGEHPTLGKRIALKVLRPELSLRDDIVHRFVQEARAVNTIGHANIVNIYDFGRTPFGSFYIVMEYLDGRTIRQVLDTAGPMPLERIRMVVTGVGAALSAAHAKGFIHRDIKPENIMVVSRMGQEQVKLLDFGIVKLLNPEVTRRTHTGSAMGTPQYMCPEQLEEAPLDHRADIYSLGAVTYEMLTGQVPFPGRSHAEVRQLQLTRTPSPPSVVRNQSRLSRALDGAVLWALALDPASRCRRMEDFISAFQVGYERTLVEQALPTQAPQRRKVGVIAAWSAGLVIAAGLGGAVAYLAKSKSGTTVRPDSRATLAPVKKTLTDAEAARSASAKLREALAATEKRAMAIAAIRTVGRPVFLPELRKALKDPHPEVVREAAETLAELRDKEAIPALRQVLREALQVPRPKPVLTVVASALATLRDEAGKEWLLKSLKQSKVHQERWLYLLPLAHLGDPSGMELQKMIGPGHMAQTENKLKALGALAFLGDGSARKQLEAMTRDGSWAERLRAAEFLSDTDPSVKEIFAQAIDASPRTERLRAAEQLAHFKDSRSASVLLEFLRSKDENERRRSALALGRLDKEGRQELAAALSDPSPDVALAAAAALTRP